MSRSLLQRGAALRAVVERNAGLALVAGLIGATAFNLALWRREKARARRATTPHAEHAHAAGAPVVSVLLPAWNEAEQLPACLASLLALRYPRLEIVVCAGGGDATLEVARQHAGPRVIVVEQQPGMGKQRALQACYERSRGEILFLTDADCVVDDASFERTLAPVVGGLAPAATGSRQPLRSQHASSLALYQWAFHLYMEATLPATAAALYGINAAVRRDALDRAGAFAAPVTIGTDYYLYEQLRHAGEQVQFVRASRVQTDYLTHVGAYMRQQARWFRNCLLHGRRFGSHAISLGHLRAGVAALFMLGGPLLGWLAGRVVWAAWLVALWHLLLSLARTVAIARRFGGLRGVAWRHYLIFPFYMLVNWAAMARGLIESLLPGRRDRW